MIIKEQQLAQESDEARSTDISTNAGEPTPGHAGVSTSTPAERCPPMRDERWRVLYAQVPLELLAELTGTETKVFAALAGLAYVDGMAWPGCTLLAQITGLYRGDVRRALAGLESKRVIKKVERTRGGRGHTNQYRVLRRVMPKSALQEMGVPSGYKRGYASGEMGVSSDGNDNAGRDLRAEKSMNRDDNDAGAKDFASQGEASPTTDACPTCGGRLLMRQSRRGVQFLGCEHYPDCTFTCSLPRQRITPTTTPPDESDGPGHHRCYDCETYVAESESQLVQGYPVPDKSVWCCRDAHACEQRARRRRAAEMKG